jgi:hypothetical protein
VLNRSLIDLVQLVRQSHAGVALVYDEFHEIWDGRKPRQTPLATFFGAIKEVQVQSGGVIVVASGLPSVVPNIVRSRSYLERDLNVAKIDHLTAADARAAIAVPLSRSAITFTSDLVERIVEETRGYPYFIQAYSSFLIDSVPRISLRCTERRSGHGPQVEVAKQTHSHTPAHDGDAEITQDLFLTKWSSIPGEFEAPLAPTVDFGGDHLLRFKTYLGSKRRAHQS